MHEILDFLSLLDFGPAVPRLSSTPPSGRGGVGPLVENEGGDGGTPSPPWPGGYPPGQGG